MSFSFIAAAALHATTASGAHLACSLVTPGAESIEFVIAAAPGAGSAGHAILPQGRSIWPSAALLAVPDRAASGRIIVGGRGGLALDLGDRAGSSTGSIALLSRWDGRRPTYPVAVGRCRPMSSAETTIPSVLTTSVSAGSEISAFDPRRWPEDCGLLLEDGRRIRFDYTLEGPGGAVRVESPQLWGGRPVRTRWVGVPSGNSRFGGQSGPAGTERLLGHTDVRAKIIHFSRIGDPSVSAQTGLGICGYSNVVRRPNTQ